MENSLNCLWPKGYRLSDSRGGAFADVGVVVTLRALSDANGARDTDFADQGTEVDPAKTFLEDPSHYHPKYAKLIWSSVHLRRGWLSIFRTTNPDLLNQMAKCELSRQLETRRQRTHLKRLQTRRSYVDLLGKRPSQKDIDFITGRCCVDRFTDMNKRGRRILAEFRLLSNDVQQTFHCFQTRERIIFD